MARMQLGLSEEELAKRADLPLRYVRGVERAQINLTLSALESLAQALDLPAQQLFAANDLRERD